MSRGVGTGGARGPSPPPKFSEDTMRNDQSAASALFGCESGLSKPEIGLEHDKWQNLHDACLQKQLHFNSLCHVHLISSVSRPQRPLIYDCIYFSFPPPPPLPRHQHFRGKFFRCPFHSKGAPRNLCPPPPHTHFLMLPAPLLATYTTIIIPSYLSLNLCLIWYFLLFMYST